MALTNNLKTQVDLPVWEWMRFAPQNTAATTALTTAEDGSSRYLYYFGGTNILYRYDTIGDSWQQLSVNATPNSNLGAKYSKNQGYRGSVISATSDTLQIPSTRLNFTNYEIEIVSGTGKGQRRTITSVNPEVIHDTGTATAAGANSITDSAKRYRFNQWEGYAVRLIYNTGLGQYREIIYNTNDTLTVFDANYDSRNFLMAAFSSTGPTVGPPSSTSGTQTTYAIVSQVVNLNSPWDIIPDKTSKFKILSGGIWWISGNTSTPFWSFYYYDILSDRFVQKVSPAAIWSSTLSFANDIGLLVTSKLFTYFTGSITSLSSKSLSDSTLNLIQNDWIGTNLTIISGSGLGNNKSIISNTTNSFTINNNWDEMPVVGSKYAVTPEDAIFLIGNGRPALFKYYPEPSLWAMGNIIDNGTAFNLVLQKPDRMQSIGVTSATRVTNGIISINTTPTAGGTGYSVGELLTVNGGTAGRVRVESINPANGAVLSVSLHSAGSGYTVASGVATTTFATAGGGSGCTVQVTSITGTIGVITTAVNHDLLLGDTITFKGATEAAWNATYTITGIQSLTVVEVSTTAAATAVAKYSFSGQLVVDETANWTPNEYTGKILGIQSNGLGGNVSWRKIIGNSQTTITYVGGLTPTNGTSRYFIQDVDAFGQDQAYLAVSQSSYGFVSSATTSSITDTSKSWPMRAWGNHKIHFRSASGEHFENIITTSTTSSLNLGRVVAVGSGTNTLGYWDTNGSGSITANGSSIFNTSGNGVCWNGTRFVAVGTSTALNTIAWSHDGITWIGLGQTIHTTAGNGVAWNGIRFITVGEGTNTISWAHDGTAAGSFSGLGTSIFSTRGRSIAWNGTRWVAVGEGTNTIAHCIDTGSSVTFIGLGTSIFSTAGRGVCWAGTQFVAVGNGTNNFATSSNGVTWAGGGAGPFSTQGNAVAWNGNITVAVGQGTNTIAYSTDSGSTWTGIGTSIFSTSGNSIAWNGSYWIAGGQGTNTSAHSVDGINWTGNGATIITTQVSGIASPTPFRSMTPNIGFILNSNTSYRIQDVSGMPTSTTSTSLTDPTKNWKINQWAGKRVMLNGPNGFSQESTVSTNTATTLSFGSTTTTDTATTYTILGKIAANAGTTLQWNWSGSLNSDRGKKILSPRGLTWSSLEVYDIRTNTWEYGLFTAGYGEGISTGTMWAYDGDRAYFQKDATGRIYYYDFVKNQVVPFATIPYGMSTAVAGNRMEIIRTEDGLKYLYIMRHSSNEMWRTLIYY
jgi:hypothetical protein